MRGYNNLLNSYAFIQLNTLSNVVYPKKGIQFFGQVGYNFNQHHDLDFYRNGNIILSEDSIKGQFSNYWYMQASFKNYLPITPKFTFLTAMQLGVSFHSKSIFNGDYYIGGLTSSFPNQIVFAGLGEGTARSNSAAMLQAGLRFHPYTNLYVTAKTNVLAYDFIKNSEISRNANFLSGYSLTLGYNFILGPLELSVMYCDQSKKLLPYINLGIPF